MHSVTRKVSIAEDDKSIRILLSRILKEMKHEIVAYDDGEGLINQIDADQPQLVILDIMMPRKDGIATLMEIRNRPKTANLPVIMLTAKSSAENVIKAAKMGATDFITKPFEIAQLMERLKPYGMELSLEDVREISANLRMPATDMMSDPLVRASGKKRIPFRIQHQGLNFCILIDETVRPSTIPKLKDEQIAEHLQIYTRCACSWLKVWPSFTLEITEVDRDADFTLAELLAADQS